MRVRTSKAYGVAALATVALIAPACGTAHTRGPLASSVPPAGASSTPANVGAVYSTGLIELHNSTSHPIVLDSAELVGVTGGLVMVGAGVQRDRSTEVGLAPGFPPDPAHPLAPVRGWILKAGDQGNPIVVGVKATRGGVSAYQAVRLNYQFEGRAYDTDFPIGMEICAPVRRWAKTGCPTPKLPD